ncbi:MAG: ATP-binding cassette domain-containing protein [Rhodocyclaceae bacterium]|nr:ATP-binding cassette domain-containing protein [Rhodocyclaceae bacterium]
MPLLSLTNGCLAFGHVALLDHADLQIDAGEKLALIGRNGSGKSSLLRSLLGEASLDDGQIWRAPGLRVAYVPQEPLFEPGDKIFDVVASGMGDAARLLVDYHEATQRVARDDSTAAIEHMMALQAELEAIDGWNLTTRVEQMLSVLKLDGDVQVGTLSGGGIKRVALARALVSEPDLLLLDEPTNHLDLAGILWLEALIKDFSGAVVVITHDRSFLDSIATRIIELDRGHLVSFPGSFAEYQKRKAQMLADEAVVNAKFDKFLAQEEVWIRKGVEARRTRNEGRVLRLEQLRRDRAERRERQGKVNLELARGEASGKMVAELEHVSKAYGERTIVRDFSTRIQRGDKIGLIGRNGAGKTTLLKLVLGQLEPDSGSVRLGSKMEVAYFDQFREQLDPEAAIVDVISPGSDYVEINGKKKHVISYLEDFLFSGARARSPVRSLSGGERNRLLLARLFAKPANVLVLDEPTNDLDIETLELLEALLQEYDGTLFLVSHDRRFLDNVVTQTIVAEGSDANPGLWKEYVGGYEDWLRQRPEGGISAMPGVGAPIEKPLAAEQPAKSVSDAAAKAAAKPGKSKLSFKEQKELNDLPARIATLESSVAALQGRLADPALYQSGGDEARKVQAQLEADEAGLLEALERWEVLEARNL